MPIPFQRVPDWTSFENQGGGVAAVDLDGDGNPELLVLRVDHPTAGPNTGFYRVGQNVDQAGNVGNWGPWIAIPQWASMENQGSAIAVADLDGDGRPELIVAQVERRAQGLNRCLFRVGRKLDVSGNVTGGWEPWREVPGWRSAGNQGAAIAVADLDGGGTPALIVFQIENFHATNPDRPNRGFYRVAKGLQADGQISGAWGEWIEVDWFSWFNQGAGLAVADLDNNGRPELVIFQIDQPPQENAGFYRVGWNLDADGKVKGGWGPWTQVQDWNSWEDQGGGLALTRFAGGPPKAVVFHIDNPPGLNAGLFRVLPLQLDIDQAAQIGVWRLMPYLSEVLPVHAGLLHTGKVIFFAGSGNNAFRFSSKKFGSEPDGVYTSVVWDLATDTFDHPPTLRKPAPNGRPIDFFCCGHCFLPDGRILVVGGTDKYDFDIKNNAMVPSGHGFLGTAEAMVFDPAAETWASVQKMAHGRWYPTAVLRGDGTVVVASGLRDGNGLPNDTIEFTRDAVAVPWAKSRDFALPLYPHLFLLRDGRFFFTGGKMDTEQPFQPFRFDPLAAAAPSEVAADLRDLGRRNQCASVILPPAQDQKFMIIGGGPEDENEATDNVDVIDVTQAPLAYKPAARLNFDRMHVNAVILPDRTVLAVGGGGIREAGRQRGQIPQLVKQRLFVEQFDPSLDPAGTWRKLAEAQVPRLYHSVALLLPDGRVVAAGGNPDKGSQVNWLPADDMEEMRLEIYSPPYLFKGARPRITSVPTQLAYGSAFAIGTDQANQIQWVSLIRPGLTTHSFNGDQRLVDVPFQVNGSVLQANLTNEKNLAPPGWYMLFLTKTNGVPSVAKWVQVS